MRITIDIIIIILSTSFSFGQSPEWHLKGITSDGNVKAYVVDDHRGKNSYALIYKNGYQDDTLTFKTNGLSDYQIDTFLIKSIQIDGKGLNEIVIKYQEKRSLASYVKESKNLETFNKIWNLDNSKEIFSCREKFFKSDLIRDGDEKTKSIDTISCSYDFSINENGLITINNIKTYTVFCNYLWVKNKKTWELKNIEKVKIKTPNLPDKKEGIYKFQNGEYIFEDPIIKNDSLLNKLQSKLIDDWNLKVSNDTLFIESENYIWLDFYNSAGAPHDDPEYAKFTDEYLQKNGRKTKMIVLFDIQNKWDAQKISQAENENKKIYTKADSLIYKYKLDHLKRSYRYSEELIWGATEDEEKRFEEYKIEKEKILQKIIEIPIYNSQNYSLFVISKTWYFSNKSYHMLPMIYPDEEGKKIFVLENIIDEVLRKDPQ